MATVTRTQLVRRISATTCVGEEAVRAVLDALEFEVLESCREGNNVTLAGFGSFQRRARAARTGRNPRTGEPVAVPASITIAFSLGAPAHALINKEG